MKTIKDANTGLALTAKIAKSSDGRFYGIIEEVPGVLSVGATKEELVNNLIDATKAMFEANKIISKEKSNNIFDDKQVFEEKVCFA